MVDLYLILYVDADFAGGVEDARSTSGGLLVLAGPNTWFPLGWVCKRQSATAHSTTESECVSLAYSLFGEGLPMMDLLDILFDRPVRLVIKEDNQATIPIVKRGFSLKLRHVLRTHKVNLGSISDVLAQDNVEIEYVESPKQAADIFTKALQPHAWPNALSLLRFRGKDDAEIPPRSDEPASDAKAKESSLSASDPVKLAQGSPSDDTQTGIAACAHICEDLYHEVQHNLSN